LRNACRDALVQTEGFELRGDGSVWAHDVAGDRSNNILSQLLVVRSVTKTCDEAAHPGYVGLLGGRMGLCVRIAVRGLWVEALSCLDLDDKSIIALDI
jgi:hypothetical protein